MKTYIITMSSILFILTAIEFIVFGWQAVAVTYVSVLSPFIIAYVVFFLIVSPIINFLEKYDLI